MTQSVSQREFAKQIGRSNVWVSKLVKAGKLPVDAKGKIPLEAGLAAYTASQEVGRDAQRENNEKVRQEIASQKGVKRKSVKLEPMLDDGDDEDAPLPTVGGLSPQNITQAFNKAKLAEKTYQAKLKELEYQKEKGILLTREQVEADAAAVASELRNKLMGMGARIGPLCEGRTAREIEMIIEDEINETLKSLQKSEFMSE